MIDPNSPCEACGGSALGGFTFPTGFIGFPDVGGAHYCVSCVDRYDTLGKMADAIRLRRSAPQQAQVMSAEGREIRIGDMIRGTNWEGSHHNAKAASVKVDRILFDAFLANPEHAKGWRHESAQPPGADVKPKLEPRFSSKVEREEHEAALKTHGVSSTENSRRTGPAPAAQRDASGGPPGVSLAAFTAAVNEHLLPRLPKGWRCITDQRFGGAWFDCWVLDDRGAEVFAFHRKACYGPGYHLEDVSDEIARRLLSRLARPATERSGR